MWRERMQRLCLCVLSVPTSGVILGFWGEGNGSAVS